MYWDVNLTSHVAHVARLNSRVYTWQKKDKNIFINILIKNHYELDKEVYLPLKFINSTLFH